MWFKVDPIVLRLILALCGPTCVTLYESFSIVCFLMIHSESFAVPGAKVQRNLEQAVSSDGFLRFSAIFASRQAGQVKESQVRVSASFLLWALFVSSHGVLKSMHSNSVQRQPLQSLFWTIMISCLELLHKSAIVAEEGQRETFLCMRAVSGVGMLYSLYSESSLVGYVREQWIDAIAVWCIHLL